MGLGDALLETRNASAAHHNQAIHQEHLGRFSFVDTIATEIGSNGGGEPPAVPRRVMQASVPSVSPALEPRKG